MGKKRCKLSDKQYADKMPSKAKYECKKCGRLSKKDENVCKPVKY